MSAVTESGLSIQEAFQEAKAEHSATQSEPSTSEASTESASTDTTPNEATTEPSASDAVTTTDISDFLTDEEVASLKSKHGTDADALVKDLKAAYTKKTQALAAERGQVKDLLDHADLVKALKTNGVETLKQLAEQNGFTLAPKTAATQATETAAARTEAASTEMVDKVKAALGPDLDFLAEPMARVLTDALKDTVGKAIEPLQSAQQTLLDKAATDQRDAVMKAFEAKHPDWKQHESAMDALMGKLTPNGMEPAEYLDLLYDVATKDRREADAVKKYIASTQKAAKQDEGKANGLSGDKVTEKLTGDYTIRDAWEAAKRELHGRA